MSGTIAKAILTNALTLLALALPFGGTAAQFAIIAGDDSQKEQHLNLSGRYEFKQTGERSMGEGYTTYVAYLNDAWVTDAASTLTLAIKDAPYTAPDGVDRPQVLISNMAEMPVRVTADNFRNEEGELRATLRFSNNLLIDKLFIFVREGEMYIAPERALSRFGTMWIEDGNGGSTGNYSGSYLLADGAEEYHQFVVKDWNNPTWKTDKLLRIGINNVPGTWTHKNRTHGTNHFRFTDGNYTETDKYYEVKVEGDVLSYFWCEDTGESVKGKKLTSDLDIKSEIQFYAHSLQLKLDPENGEPTEATLRLYKQGNVPADGMAKVWDSNNEDQKYRYNKLQFWHGELIAKWNETSGNGSKEPWIEYYRNSADGRYRYFRLVVDHPGLATDINYVIQCEFHSIDGETDADLAFDARQSDVWWPLKKKDSRIGFSRIKVGMKVNTIYLRQDLQAGSRENQYAILFSSNGSLAENAVAPRYNDDIHTMTVLRGTPLYNLLHGTDESDELTLRLDRKVSSPEWYQINLGRTLTLSRDQFFTFRVNSNGTESIARQFTVAAANQEFAPEAAGESRITAGTAFDRILLRVSYNEQTAQYDYTLRVVNGAENLPAEFAQPSKHSLPLLKTWRTNNENDPNHSGKLYEIASPYHVDGDVNYYQFKRVNYKGEVLENGGNAKGNLEERPHPNVFYLPLEQGVELNADFNPEGFNFNPENVREMGHLDIFNIIDEDGYDVGNPMQGGQWFYGNTWWAANPRVVPEDADPTGEWTANMRPKPGTPGDLVVGEKMTVYGITVFRIAGKRYDMYSTRPDDRFTAGNIFYVYFNTDASKKTAEMTSPIMVNFLRGAAPQFAEGSQHNNYTAKDNNYDGKSFNTPTFVQNNGQAPLMLTCDGVTEQGDAIYAALLSNYTPGDDAPMEIVSVTNSQVWNPSDPMNDMLTPSRYSRYYAGRSVNTSRERSSRQSAPAVDESLQGLDAIFVQKKDLAYTRLQLSMNADMVRYMLQADVPTIDLATTQKHDATQGNLIYPELEVNVSAPYRSADHNASESNELTVRVEIETTPGQFTTLYYKYTDINVDYDNGNGQATAKVKVSTDGVNYSEEKPATIPYLKDDPENGVVLSTEEKEVLLQFDYLYDYAPDNSQVKVSVTRGDATHDALSTASFHYVDPRVEITADNLEALNYHVDNTTYYADLSYQSTANDDLPATYTVYQFNTEDTYWQDKEITESTLQQAVTDGKAWVIINESEDEKEVAERTQTTHGTRIADLPEEHGQRNITLGYAVVMHYTFSSPSTPAIAPESHDFKNAAEGYTNEVRNAVGDDTANTSFSTNLVTGLDTLEGSTLTVTAAPGTITVSGTDRAVMVTGINGTVVYNGPAGTIAVAPGLYLLTTEFGTLKVNAK